MQGQETATAMTQYTISQIMGPDICTSVTDATDILAEARSVVAGRRAQGLGTDGGPEYDVLVAGRIIGSVRIGDMCTACYAYQLEERCDRPCRCLHGLAVPEVADAEIRALEREAYAGNDTVTYELCQQALAREDRSVWPSAIGAKPITRAAARLACARAIDARRR